MSHLELFFLIASPTERKHIEIRSTVQIHGKKMRKNLKEGMKIYCIECKDKYWNLYEKIEIKCLSEYRYIFRLGAVAFKSCNMIDPLTGLYTQQIQSFELVCENCLISRRKIEAVRAADANTKTTADVENTLNLARQKIKQMQKQIQMLRKKTKQIDVEDLRTCKEILSYKSVDKLVRSVLIHNKVTEVMCELNQQNQSGLFSFVNKPSLNLVNLINHQTSIFLNQMFKGVSFLLYRQAVKLDRTFSLENAIKLRMEQKSYVKDHKMQLFTRQQLNSSSAVYVELIKKTKIHIEQFQKIKQQISNLISIYQEY